ncbi:MAG: hypothetical protein H0T62_06305 [Parachlamydiaceae bacterium]|nr:hypothetical protein [Parachlamydiaceae bacterium]
MMKNFNELAQEVKLRQLSPEEVKFVLQKVKELTLSNDNDLSSWAYLLEYVKEYQGFELLGPEKYEVKVEKTIKDFYFLAKYCPNIESIRLAMADDEVLCCLKLFPKLLRFRLDDGSCITEQGIKHVWRLTHLTHLILNEYRDVYDLFIKNLCQLNHLFVLDLSRCNHIFDHNLEQISRLKHLNSLNLRFSVYITDAGMPYIATMKNLVRLGVGGTHITDQGILVLSALSQLKELLLRKSEITDEGLKHLASFSNLETVDLSYCKNITDQGLPHLNRISTLQTVDLSECQNITEQGIKQLFPQIQVIQLNQKNRDFYVFN